MPDQGALDFDIILPITCIYEMQNEWHKPNT